MLDALQELTRLAVYRETGERSRLMLDIVRLPRRAARAPGRAGQDAVAEVKESGEPVSLEPMTPFERKVVHDAVAAAGLTSESEGVEPRRYVGDPAGLIDDVSRETAPVIHERPTLRAPDTRGGAEGVRVSTGSRWPSGTPRCWRPTASCVA